MTRSTDREFRTLILKAGAWLFGVLGSGLLGITLYAYRGDNQLLRTEIAANRACCEKHERRLEALPAGIGDLTRDVAELKRDRISLAHTLQHLADVISARELADREREERLREREQNGG